MSTKQAIYRRKNRVIDSRTTKPELRWPFPSEYNTWNLKSSWSGTIGVGTNHVSARISLGMVVIDIPVFNAGSNPFASRDSPCPTTFHPSSVAGGFSPILPFAHTTHQCVEETTPTPY